MKPFAQARHIEPPRAERRAIRMSRWGVDIDDDYAWLRAENWREALLDPRKLPKPVRALLKAENAYAKQILKGNAQLEAKILDELHGRMDETDCDPPARDGDWLYYARYREDGDYELICRRPAEGGKEDILLDGDKESEGKDFFSLSDAVHSPDHRLLAWSRDERGNELCRISWRDLMTGREGEDVVENAEGTIVWTCDSRAFLYTRIDEDFRTAQIFLHEIGADPASDRLAFEEKDPGWFVNLKAARSRRHAIFTVNDHDCSECWLFDLAHPGKPPRLVLPRQPGLRYDVEPGLDRLFMRTNADGAFDYKLLSLNLDVFEREGWRADLCSEEAPHRPGRMIFNATVFADYLVWLERENGQPRLILRSRAAETHEIGFDAECYHLRLERNFDFMRPLLRFSYSSRTEPQEIFDLDLTTREKISVKRQRIPSGHDAKLYQARRVFAPTEDGETVPVSLLWRRDRAPGPGPVLLYGYGAYGVALPDAFDEDQLTLVDRGFIHAIAHVRGGSEKGERWHETGKLEHKFNTFTDFIASARHLCDLGLTAPGLIVAEGGSAGGMLMGAAANLAPELFGAVLAEVPFVDVLNTICDASLPLTPPEWREWGNPIEDEAAFRRMLAYSPYENVKAQAYPPMLIEAGLTDPRVTYWEPAKWTQQLRARMVAGGPILLVTNMDAGHAGAAGRSDEKGEIARRQAFAVTALGGETELTPRPLR